MVSDPTAAEITRAADVLRSGGLVAFPTETVYGLGADASCATAVARLYAVKGRPLDHPVIVHLADASQLDEWAARVPEPARALAAACWPGPLTLVVPRSGRVADAVTGGLATVGLRVPDQPVAHALLHEFGGGVAAPSANRFGRVSPTTAAAVRESLGDDVDVVLDGGLCRVGVESTIVDCSGDVPTVLRLGGVALEAIEDVLEHPVALETRGEVRAPGTLKAHYAPRARVEVVDDDDLVGRVEAARRRRDRIGVIGEKLPGTLPDDVVVLARPADADDYARVLYRSLRDADARGLDLVLAVPPSAVGIGAAVNDRLRRAAATNEREHGDGDA